MLGAFLFYDVAFIVPPPGAQRVCEHVRGELHPTDTRGFPEESKCIGCLPIRRQVVADAKLGGSGTVKLKDGQSGGLVGFIGLSPAIGEVLAHGALWRSGFGYHNDRGAFQGAFKAIGCLPKFSKTVVKKGSSCIVVGKKIKQLHWKAVV